MDYTQFARDAFNGDRYAVKTTGVRIDEVRELYARCSLVIEEKHMNKLGTVMGGAIFTLADYAFGAAANTINENCVSLSSHINFIRATKGPVLYAEAKCVKDGRNICFFDVTITDSNGNIVADATFDGFRSNR